ncbi:aminopeptidase P family protein [Nitrosophilus labii]|uniref:aminopeptidase P family protein n=1 Tax=Nitrosophilus labii TaxID=2706014 RepID=UPI001657345E|nr:aminopeptidase P family protein [Nitrosophilus labii]
MENYILKDENAVYYDCGYSCDNEIFLKVGDETYFFTDARYSQDAKENIKEAYVVETRSLLKSVREVLRKKRVKKLVYDPKDFTVAQFEELKKSGVYLIPKPMFSWKKRAIKSDEEIELIKKSAQINKKAFDKFASFLDREGRNRSEKFLQFNSKIILSDFGERDLSFEPIFAINENAAKPHAHPTPKVLKNGDLILFDAGVKYKRYCSDRTRTSLISDGLTFEYKQSFNNSNIQKAYDLVLKAHDEAIKRARSGMRAREIDKIARDVIEKGGFGEFFVHSTGHGVGLDIHEMPFISSKSETIIEDNMVFTIEPGIYIPGEFGIRIEDMVVMRGGRAEII